LLAGLTIPALAQNPVIIPNEGLATASPESVLPANQPSPSTAAAATEKTSDLIPPPVSADPLPNVSPESIGLSAEKGLGADMWKGTPRPIAERLLSILTPTVSPVLNDLARRLLITAAVPPDGKALSAQKLTSERIEKLAAFGAGSEAWALARRADDKLIDDVSFHLAAETALTGNDGDDLCGKASDLAKTHPSTDWQEVFIVCQLRAKDTKAAQVALDVFRSQSRRDNVFIGIADKNILGSSKNLPFQITPMTPATLALLQIVNLPLPGEVYAHADFSLAAALLRLPAQEGVAKLALAERAFARGMIGKDDLANVYRAIAFSPDALASPLASNESGVRLHALLFRAAEAEKDPGKRIELAAKFMQVAPPAFLNGAGSVAAQMLGDIKADTTQAANAAIVARIYMLAGQNDQAADWLHLAETQKTPDSSLQNLWPQFALAGLDAGSSYEADFDQWLDAALKDSDPATRRDIVGGTMLLMNAAGLKVPDASWSKVIAAPHNEKHVAFSPVLYDRLQAASAAGRRAETVLLALAIAGDKDISLPAAIGITRAVRLAGFANEASLFARQAVALLEKGN
jgi:hypothetical protein